MIDLLLRFLTPRRVRSYPLVAFLVLAAVAAYDRLSGKGLLNGIAGAFGGDFLSFYTGGACLLRGMPSWLSDPAAQAALQREILHADVNAVSVWVSPPYFAWFFAPLAALPYTVAFIVFITASSALLWFSFRALARELGQGSSSGRMLWIGLQYYPTVHWLLNGQTTALWLSVFTFVFVLLRRGRDVSAGLLLGCLACKPTLALGLTVGLLLARRWRSLCSAGVTALGAIALGFVTLPDAMNAYLHRAPALVALVRDEGYNAAGLHGSFEFATLLLDGVSPALGTVVGSASVLFVLATIAAFTWRAPWTPASRAWDLRLAATLAFGVIASPHLFAYDLMLLLLPLFVVAAHYPTLNGLPLAGGLLLVLTALVWALGLVGPTLTFAEQELTRRLFGFPAALQIGIPAVFLWAFAVARSAGPERATSS